MKTISLFILSVFLLVSCIGDKHNPIKEVNWLDNDSLFAFKNISTTTEKDFYEAKLVQLDSLQKRKIMPDITKELAMDKEFPYSSLFPVYFLSKQPKVGAITPIIIKATCDDFAALILISIDEKNNPVDYRIIDRNEFCGADSISECEHYKHSILKADKIITYNLLQIIDSQTHKTSSLDSVSYQSIISPQGKITTQKTDSVKVK